MQQFKGMGRLMGTCPRFLCSGNKSDEQSLRKANDYVLEKLRNRDWSSYVLMSYYPKEVRNAFCAIHMFVMELRKIAETTRESSLALGKMEFWRSVIYKIYQSQLPSEEPISISLNDACRHHPLTKGYFERLINVYSRQLSERYIESTDEMFRMAQESKSTLICLCLELLRIEIKSEEMRKCITYLGRTIGMCEYLKRVPYSLKNNRVLLPHNLLTKHNLGSGRLWDRRYGKPYEEVFDVVLEVAALAKQSFAEAVKIYMENPSAFPQHSFRAFLKGVQSQLYLQDLQKYNFDLFAGPLNRHSTLKLPYRVFQSAKKKKFYYNL